MQDIQSVLQSLQAILHLTNSLVYLGGDEMMTKAILDRILHYSYLFNINGPSYRIKDKLDPKKVRNLKCNKLWNR